MMLSCGGGSSSNPTPIAPGNGYAFDPKVGASTQTYDPAKAKAELAAAGLPNGYSVTCTTSTDPVWVQQTTIAKASLAQVGIDLQVTTAPSPAFYQAYFDKKFNILMSGFSGRADPIDTLNYLYAGNGYYGHIKIQPVRPDIDAILTKAVATKDNTARAALYNQVVQTAADNAYDVYMLYPDTLAASNKLHFDVFGDGKPHLGQGDVCFA